MCLIHPPRLNRRIEASIFLRARHSLSRGFPLSRPRPVLIRGGLSSVANIAMNQGFKTLFTRQDGRSG